MSDGVHLSIPFASAQGAGAREALAALQLPHLEALLGRMVPVARDEGDAQSLSMPHERVIARCAGIDAADGRIPLAALELASAGGAPGGEAWAWITPCHWRVGADRVEMAAPDAIQLDETQSLQLLAVMRPFFEEDGLTLEYGEALRWRARGAIFAGLATASLDRVWGHTIDAWMPRTAQAGPLRRLQQEMQMLLYTHTINDERQARALAAVNSFWVSGAGALPAAGVRLSELPRTLDALRPHALRADWPAWRDAWRELDVNELAPLSSRLDAGERVTLTLCGERSAQTFGTPPSGGYLRGLGARVASMFGRSRVAPLLEGL